MNYKTFLTVAATSVFTLGLTSVRAEDMPMGMPPAAPMPGMAKPDATMPGMDKDKMSMDDMMKECNDYATSCNKHIDEAMAAAEAKNFDEVKMHLAHAKKDMAGCMSVMEKMSKMDKPDKMKGMDMMKDMDMMDKPKPVEKTPPAMPMGHM